MFQCFNVSYAFEIAWLNFPLSIALEVISFFGYLISLVINVYHQRLILNNSYSFIVDKFIQYCHKVSEAMYEQYVYVKDFGNIMDESFDFSNHCIKYIHMYVYMDECM
jgi:hypothetical protein